MSVTTAPPILRTPATVVLTAASHTVAFDSSAVVGDALLLVVEQLSSTGAPTTPSGWTLRGTNTHGTRVFYAYTKVRATGETSVTVTRAAAGAGRATVEAIGGVKPDQSTWIFGTPRGRATSPADTSTSTTALGITTTAPDTLVVSIFGEATTTAEASAPTVSGATSFYYAGQQSTGDIETILLASKTMHAAGATGNAVATYPNAQASNSGAMMIGFPSVETDTTPQPVARLAGKMSDGAGHIVDVGMVGWDGTAEVALSKLDLVHSGALVPELDSTSRVWWMAHRGGSADYQEHSARGYVQSAIAHADVLEFSVAFTSDGVMFGLHDDTLNRTSSSLGSTPVKPGDVTWSQVQQLVQDLPNRGDSRFTTAPYLRIDDFIAQWSPSHTLMFDPKWLTATQRQALLARIQQIPDYQRRVLGKFYTTGTDRAAEFHSIGVKAWGYSYTADVQNGAAERTAGSWDYLGLEYTATAATWTEMLRIAAGKRIIAHIVGTAAQAQGAVANGARALQAAGVNSISTAY